MNGPDDSDLLQAGALSTDPTADAEPYEPSVSPPSPRSFQGDDNDLVDAFVADHGENVRYCSEEGNWLLWDGMRWRRDDSLQVEGLARPSLEKVARAARLRADQLEAAGRKTISRKLRSFAKRARSPQGVKIALQGAAGSGRTPDKQRICLPRTAFDSVEKTRLLLNVQNGVLDPTTGELIPHPESKELLITKLVPVAYRPEAGCPKFLKALDGIFEADTKGQERADRLIDLLQIGLGYSLIGDQSLHLVFLLYGPEGRNGKSMMIRLLLRVLGPDYSQMAAPGLLKKRRFESHPTEVADLYGARFVAATETARGEVFNEAVLKHLTGGDRLKARRMHQDFFEFEPTHLFWIASNFLPHADAFDEAFWARVRVIPFARRFVLPGEAGYEAAADAARAILDLEEQILEESEGVLAWMVEGCRKYWLSKAIPDPPEARAALEDYRRSNDPLLDWMEARCEIEGTCLEDRCHLPEEWRTEVRRLFADYSDWTKERSEHAASMQGFTRGLTAKGFPTDRTGKGRSRRRCGIRLVQGRAR